MTLLPTDSWNVKPRLDLPPYELNDVDPVDGAKFGLEDHHIWRKSFTALSKEDGKRLFWVELEDGTVVPNRVALSNATHSAITTNRARLALVEVEEAEHIGMKGYRFEYQDLVTGETTELSFQPGPAMQLTVDGREEPWQGHVHDNEEPCPKCKGRGKVAKPEPKGEHEQAPPRPKTTWSVRVPKDEREDGYEVIDTLVEDSVEKLKEANLLKSANRGANYYALVYVLAFFAQNFKPEAEKAS